MFYYFLALCRRNTGLRIPVHIKDSCSPVLHVLDDGGVGR